MRRRQPGADLDRGPLVLGPTERYDDGTVGVDAGALPLMGDQHCHVAGHVREDDGEVGVEHSLVEERGGGAEKDEVDFLVGCQHHEILTRRG